MSNKSLLLALSCIVSACGEEAVAPIPRRSEAVAVRAEDPRTRFCDPSSLSSARVLALPTLEGASIPSGGVRWINLWATWCAPCIEEMPLIADFTTRLQHDGIQMSAYFVSVDDSMATVEQFRGTHPGTPMTAHLPDASGIPALVASFGLDPGAGIPIHALVDANNVIRCVRSGTVHESDYATVRDIMRMQF